MNTVTTSDTLEAIDINNIGFNSIMNDNVDVNNEESGGDIENNKLKGNEVNKKYLDMSVKDLHEIINEINEKHNKKVSKSGNKNKLIERIIDNL